ncbi:MAG: thioredoxin family protein [Methanocorpusculum sp.]|uniref:thioredoxin family protein n=1 Tax=Methanocorpusculum sp. TaxID=2058474 RepID=UPI00271CB3C3|nr:thioredoxin family protein [Methanocorpusculum sp.]MDO9522556.1 thioredoxin family protein [Methanocorpusculum sp.]
MRSESDLPTPPTEALPILTLTEVNFNSFTMQIPALVIDFLTDWCGSCRFFAQIFSEVSLEYPEVQFCTCNTEENSHIAAELHIRAVPTLMFIKNGTVVKIRTSALSEEEFREDLNAVFRA